MKPLEPNKPILERAFELAREGVHLDVQALEAALRREGYVRPEMGLTCAGLRKQLGALLGNATVSSE